MPEDHVHGDTGPLTRDPRALDREPPPHVPEISIRFKSPGLLFFGATGALCAFLGSSVCVLMEFIKPKYKKNVMLNLSYPSGNAYWPETVSESVSDSNSAAGKIFYTFSLIAGIFLLISWYPYSLRNVYTGPAKMWGGLYWASFRQYCPVLGLFMLLGVSVYPSKIAAETNGGMLCLAIHLIGASMMFTGYMLCEFKTLEVKPFRMPMKINRCYLDITGFERGVRVFLVVTMFFFYVAFLVFEVLMMVVPVCCCDEWLKEGDWYNRTAPNGKTTQHVLDEATVINTASGTYLAFKFCAYWSECLAGICLIMSHYVIWFYCEERHMKYAKATLDMVYDKDYDDDGGVDWYGSRSYPGEDDDITFDDSDE